MIQQREKTDVKTNINSEAKSFGISLNSKMFNILSSNIYKDKIMAPIRELISNAYDAHKEAGNPDDYIDVYCPSIYDPKFYVRDYGTGMDEATIMELYTNYGASTRDNTNDAIGCFGIGSKSPFAYTTNYTITNYTGSSKQVYVISMEDDIPSIRKVYEGEDTEPRGFKVELAVKNTEDARLFADKIKKFAKTFHGNIKLVDPDGTFTTYDEFKKSTKSIKNLKYSDHIDAHPYSLTSTSLAIECGGIVYNYSEGYNSMKVLNDTYKLLHKLGKYFTCVYLSVPIGSVDITASREELELTDRTRDTISKYLSESIVELSAHIRDELITEFNSSNKKITLDILSHMGRYISILETSYTKVEHVFTKNRHNPCQEFLSSVVSYYGYKYNFEFVKTLLDKMEPEKDYFMLDTEKVYGIGSHFDEAFTFLIEDDKELLEIIESCLYVLDRTSIESDDSLSGLCLNNNYYKGWVSDGTEYISRFYNTPYFLLLERVSSCNGKTYLTFDSSKVSRDLVKKYINFSSYGKDSNFFMENSYATITDKDYFTQELKDLLTSSNVKFIDVTQDTLDTKKNRYAARKINKRQAKYTIYEPVPSNYGKGRYLMSLKKHLEVGEDYGDLQFKKEPIYVFIKNGQYDSYKNTNDIVEFLEKTFSNKVLLTNNPNVKGIELSKIIDILKTIDTSLENVISKCYSSYQVNNLQRVFNDYGTLKPYVGSESMDIVLESMKGIPKYELEDFANKFKDLGLELADNNGSCSYEYWIYWYFDIANLRSVLIDKKAPNRYKYNYYGAVTLKEYVSEVLEITELSELTDVEKSSIISKIEKLKDFNLLLDYSFKAKLKNIVGDGYDHVVKEISTAYFS